MQCHCATHYESLSCSEGTIVSNVSITQNLSAAGSQKNARFDQTLRMPECVLLTSRFAVECSTGSKQSKQQDTKPAVDRPSTCISFRNRHRTDGAK